MDQREMEPVMVGVVPPRRVAALLEALEAAVPLEPSLRHLKRVRRMAPSAVGDAPRMEVLLCRPDAYAQLPARTLDELALVDPPPGVVLVRTRVLCCH